MTLLEVVEKVCPGERGTVQVHVMPYGIDVDKTWPTILATLRKHRVQVRVSRHVHDGNPITIDFDKYVIARPDHTVGFNWGHQYQACAELCWTYTVWMWDNTGTGYEFKESVHTTRTWKSDPGG